MPAPGSRPTSATSGGGDAIREAMRAASRSTTDDPVRDAMRAAGGGSEPSGPPSLWGQFTGLLGALPSGLGHFAADVGQDLYGVTQIPSATALAIAARYAPGNSGAELVMGIHRNRALRPFVGEEMVTQAAGGASFVDVAGETLPAGTSMFRSFRQTGERAVNAGASLAPGGLAPTETQYAEASRRGEILPVLIEDIGNAALVGEIGSRALSSSARTAVARSQAAEAAARAVEQAPVGGATAGRSMVAPRTPRGFLARRQIVNGPRQIAREVREAVTPNPAELEAARQAAGPRVFEVGGAGPAATAQVVPAEAVTLRAAADQAAEAAWRAQRRARLARSVVRLGDTVADAPARIWAWPIEKAWKVSEPARVAFGQSTVGASLRSRADETIGQAFRNAAGRAEMRRDIHERGELPWVEGQGEIRLNSIAAMKPLTEVEDIAGHVAIAGVSDALAPVIRDIEDQLAASLGITPEEAHAWAVTEALGENVPVEAFDLADQYQRTARWLEEAQAAKDEGRPQPAAPRDALTPDQFFRIQEAQRILQETVRDPRHSRYFRGHGESRGPRPVVERSRFVTDKLERQGLDITESPESVAADAAAREQHAQVIAGRVEQRGSEPLSAVVQAAIERFGPKIDQAVRDVVAAQEVANREGGRRIIHRDAYAASVTEQVRELYADARDVAQVIVDNDPVLARAVGAPDARVQVTPERLVDLVAGRLVSARGSRNPALRQLMKDLKDAGYEVPFDLPNPAVLRAAEARAEQSARARIFAREAETAQGRADRATAAREEWEGRPQRVAYAPEGATSRLEARTRALDSARRAAAAGPNPIDADIAVREARRAAAGEAFGVDVRPGEPFRVPRDKITGEQADPAPLANTTDADGNYQPGMLADIDMRGGVLNPEPGAITEVTPGRFMQGERVWIAYNDEGVAAGYIATFGDGTGLSIFVAPDARGQGLGLRLYEAVEQAGVDVHQALADEQFTVEGARLYERFVNGPAEGLAVTYDSPVQRRVFETAAEQERRLEAAARRQAAGEQQTIEPAAGEPVPVRDGPMPEQPGARKVLRVDGVEAGRAPDDVADGEYWINRKTGKMVPWDDRVGDSTRPVTLDVEPVGVDELGFNNYFDAMDDQAREQFYRTYNDLPFDTEGQNIADELADRAAPAAEPLYPVRVGPGTAINFSSRQLAETAAEEGRPNPYAKIDAEVSPKSGGTVHLTRAEAQELLEQAIADADENGAYSGPDGLGYRNAANVLRQQITTRLAGDPGQVQRQAVSELLTPGQYRAVSALMDYEGGIDGWPMDAVTDVALTADEMYRRIDQRIEDLEAVEKRNATEGRELKALRGGLERLERRWPRITEAEMPTQADIDRLAFNATIARHFRDQYETVAEVESPEGFVAPGGPREGAIDTTAREGTRPEADTTDQGGVYSPELNQRLDEALAELEQRSRQAVDQVQGEWEDKFPDGELLQYLPRQAFVAGDAQRVPAEWEWFTQLPPPMQRFIRERYMAPDPAADARRVKKGYPRDPRVGTGSTPDQLAQAYSARLGRRSDQFGGEANANFELPIEEVMADWVRMIQLRDVLDRVGNVRARLSDAELDQAAEYLGMDPAVLRAIRSSEGRSRQAMLERLAQVVDEEAAAARVEAEMGPPPPVVRSGRPAPWEMSLEDYATELAEHEEVLARWAEEHPVVPGEDPLDVYEPDEVVAARSRLNELAPLEFDDADAPLAPEALYERLVQAAERHGVARTPEQVRADIRDWSDSWNQHRIEVERVRERMNELLSQSDELRSTPIDGVEAAARGLPPDHPIREFRDLSRREVNLLGRERVLVEQNQALNNELRVLEARAAAREAAPPAAGDRVFDPTARGQEAVADVEQRALEAFIEDSENRKVARLSGQAVPNEDLLYHTLNEPARAIYRQMVRDARVVTEEGRLELARRQLAQKLIARGRRAQAPISRQEGRLVARERVLQSGAREAERKATRAADRLAEMGQWEARTESLERGLGRFGAGQRKIGLREGIARTREVDLGRAERTLIRLLDARDEAARRAAESSAAAPARYADELKASNRLREAINAEAAWLDSLSDDGRGGDLLRTLTDGLPTSVFDAVEAGGAAADPVHLIGGDFATRRGPGAIMGRLDQQLPYRRRTGQERVASREVGTTKFTTKGQAIETIKRYKDGVRNELSRFLEQKYGIRPHDIGAGDLRGEALEMEMRERGFVPWDASNPLNRPPASQITGQTVFVPQELYQAFARSSFGEKPRWQANIELWYDRRFLGTLKTAWLALSPRWLVGNLVGNALMAVIGGGVDPVTLVQQMRNARALLAEDTTLSPDELADAGTVARWRDARARRLLERQEQLVQARGQVPRTLLNRGMTHEEMMFLNPDLERTTRNPVARLAQRSYALNEYTDNLFRSAVYLAKMEPRARLWDDVNAGRITSDEFMARVGNTLSARSALDAALHAAGDFQNLTPFERNVIKRLWIFYPWYRHITRLALSLPVNHPRRVIWTLHLAQVFGDPEEQADLPPFLQGSIPIGDDRYLRTGGLNPFGQVDDSPLLSPTRAVQGLTPAITWPTAIFLGIDLSRGGSRITRPPGTSRLDAYGRETNTPLWRNPTEAFRYLANQFPQGRAVYGAVEEPVLRYGQGSPVLVEGQKVPQGGGRWAAAGRLFGVPWPERVDAQAIRDRRAERIAEAETARRRYYENLNPTGGYG